MRLVANGNNQYGKLERTHGQFAVASLQSCIQPWRKTFARIVAEKLERIYVKYAVILGLQEFLISAIVFLS